MVPLAGLALTLAMAPWSLPLSGFGVGSGLCSHLSHGVVRSTPGDRDSAGTHWALVVTTCWSLEYNATYISLS